MRVAYFSILLYGLMINVTSPVSNAKGASRLKALERLISSEDEDNMRNYLILRDYLEDRAAKRKCGIVPPEYKKE